MALVARLGQAKHAFVCNTALTGVLLLLPPTAQQTWQLVIRILQEEHKSTAVVQRSYLAPACCWVCCQPVEVALQCNTPGLYEAVSHAPTLNQVPLRPRRQEAAAQTSTSISRDNVSIKIADLKAATDALRRLQLLMYASMTVCKFAQLQAPVSLTFHAAAWVGGWTG
jgi:hypothetical protein